MNTAPTFRAAMADLNTPPISIMSATAATPPARALTPAARRLIPHYSLITLAAIEHVILREYQVAAADLRGPSRLPNLVGARQMLMYLAMEMTALTCNEIGEAYKRDHSTVCHARYRVAGFASVYPAVAQQIARLRQEITQARAS